MKLSLDNTVNMRLEKGNLLNIMNSVNNLKLYVSLELFFRQHQSSCSVRYTSVFLYILHSLHSFFCTYGNYVTVTLHFGLSIYCIFSTSELYYICFSYNDIFLIILGLRFSGAFTLRMEITLQLRFAFVRHCEVFLLRHIYVIYLFDAVTFFYDFRITLYFGGTLQLRFIFVRNCDVFFITLHLRYLFVR